MGTSMKCSVSVVAWGKKARYSRATVGLFRKDEDIYLAIIRAYPSETYKYKIRPGSVELLPAAIRFRNYQLDVLVKEHSDQRYLDMLRAINIILKEDHYRLRGKNEALEKFKARIPDLSEIKEQRQPTLKTPEDRLNQRDISIIHLLNLPVELPQDLWNRPRIQELHIVNCNLSSVPKQLEVFSSTLITLDLSSNKIKHLPRTFCCKMSHLKWFNLKDNLIETLPIEIKFLSSLFDLNIANNRLRMIPSTFSDLRSLRHLNVANNNLSQLPAFRIYDIRLTSLNVSNNPLDGASNGRAVFEVHSSFDDKTLQYNVCPLNTFSRNKIPKLFEISMLNIVRCDKLLKLASETPLPQTIVSAMQRDIFKCYECSQMSILPAYNSTDTLEYVDQVMQLHRGNYSHSMTFMKLICRVCFDKAICHKIS